MKGNSATAIIDCKRQQNRPINRGKLDTITNSGIVLLAQQIDDNTFFNGDLQQLTIVPNPEAAYELCSSYIPDCDQPLPGHQREQQDDSQAGYRGISEDELLNREGISPQQYLEFTENVQEIRPNQTVTPFNEEEYTRGSDT